MDPARSRTRSGPSIVFALDVEAHEERGLEANIMAEFDREPPRGVPRPGRGILAYPSVLGHDEFDRRRFVGTFCGSVVVDSSTWST